MYKKYIHLKEMKRIIFSLSITLNHVITIGYLVYEIYFTSGTSYANV